MKYITTIIVLVIHISISFSQKINFETQFDLDFDGKVESILFVDYYDAELDDNEFHKIILVTHIDSIHVDLKGTCIPKDTLYNCADYNISNRIGIFTENNITYLWFTGYEYGCCLNKTIILKYSNGIITEILNRDFQVNSIREIGSDKYMVGTPSLFECFYYGFEDKYYSAFGSAELPLHAYSINNNFAYQPEMINRLISEEFELIGKIDNFQNVFLISTSLSESSILVSYDYYEVLSERDFGIASLEKLNKKFLRKFSKEDLRLMRNELFAIYGYKFKSADLQSYFLEKKWYTPAETNQEIIKQKQSEIEKFNVELILTIEK